MTTISRRTFLRDAGVLGASAVLADTLPAGRAPRQSGQGL
jgi:hypothetical protein